MPVTVGLQGQSHMTVGDTDTSIAFHSGDVPVLATPRLVALLEEATVHALTGHLDDGQTTVGMRVQIDHLAPTGVGIDVRATATLEAVEGRRLTFSAEATDGTSPVASATITRVVVDTSRFLERVS
ncbi:MAG: hotdog domain-containing protein [Acidimicrobiales bacterium]|nr:hotdog domain-containing protein [Acidimicrobiales bacterium]MDP6760667.1 hotdog domain-containing protein [Acidimicrobiales bacterium]